MGGALSVFVAVTSIVLFLTDGQWLMAVVATGSALACLWSWLHMWYFAQSLARQRQYVEALNCKLIQENTPHAEAFWRNMRIQVKRCDVEDIPDWITKVNLVAALVALVLLIWSIICFFWN